MSPRHALPLTTRVVVAASTACAAACVVIAPAVHGPTASGHSAPARAAVQRQAVAAAVTRTHAAAGAWSSATWGDPQADVATTDAADSYDPQRDPGSLFTVEKAIGARAVWGRRDSSGRPVTGQGVGVALLDTGVNQVPGLDTAGKVTYGPDLSIEGNGVLIDQDTYGHGTFMAGIIAGRGGDQSSAELAKAAPSVQLGVAPDASILAMKLATTDGSTDVSQVIAALDWVAQHPVLPNGTRVRVVNLSYGTDSTQQYQDDPLAAVAENAWKHGIVVVTSAGNGGTTTGSLTDPAYDPYLISVGAADSGDGLNGWAPDRTTVAAFSNVSSGRHVDLIAPGTSIVSLRDPGSYIDQNNPQGLVAGDASGTLFRGSGTSQAAAVVTGAVADLLQAFPDLTPDQVKYALVASADQVAGAPASAAGAGIIDLRQAYDLAGRLAHTVGTPAPVQAAAVQDYPASTGQGSIDAARGGAVLVDADGNDLSGEIDAQGNPWNPAAWWAASSSLTAWSGGQWMGTTWTGDGWDLSWASARWTSARWTSARWTSARWTDADWSSARWTSARWTSARWTSARWTSARWTSARWTTDSW